MDQDKYEEEETTQISYEEKREDNTKKTSSKYARSYIHGVKIKYKLYLKKQ